MNINDGIYYQYPAAKPVDKGVYECIDFANDKVLIGWDGEKFQVPEQEMVKFFKSKTYKQDNPNADNWIELR